MFAKNCLITQCNTNLVLEYFLNAYVIKVYKVYHSFQPLFLCPR